MSDRRDYEQHFNVIAGGCALLAVIVCILSNAPAAVVWLPAAVLGASAERVMSLRMRRSLEAKIDSIEALVLRAERALDAQNVVMREH